MDSTINETSQRNPAYLIAAVVLVLLLMAIGLAVFLQYRNVQDSTKSTRNQPEDVGVANACKNNTRGPLQKTLVKYMVNEGDTLLSIASDKLGDPSRLQELALLNEEKYPGLFSRQGVVSEDAFLEQGWTLMLPPPWIKNSSGKLQEMNGVILQIVPGNNAYEISWRGDAGGHYATIAPDAQTVNERNTQFKQGDCITAVVDSKTGRVLKIDLQ